MAGVNLLSEPKKYLESHVVMIIFSQKKTYDVENASFRLVLPPKFFTLPKTYIRIKKREILLIKLFADFDLQNAGWVTLL